MGLFCYTGCIDCLGNLNSDPTNCYRFSDYFQFGILDPDADADSPDSKTNRFLHFSPLLLLTTIYRLSLNITSTRLIPLNASRPLGAGLVILTFGTLVTSQNLVIGFILFVILLTIQHVVVTSGAERIAEVRARFALDTIPSRQLSIDADLSAGFITKNEACAKRRATAIEQEFYGTMDGATKFIRGDATVAIVSVIVNGLVGLIIGIGQNGLSIAKRYKLTRF